MAIKGDFESVSLKNLKMVCNELNDSKLIEKDKKVDVKKNKKKLDLVEAFMEAVESIPEDSEEESTLIKDHNKIVEMYNSLQEIVDAAEKGKGKEEEEEEEEEKVEEKEEKEPKKDKKTEKKADTKKSKAKKNDTKKEKTEKGKEKKKKGLPLAGMPKDDLGAVVGRGTNLINEELKKGGHIEEIADKLGTSKGRIRTHYGALVKCGVEFDVKYKKVSAIGGKEKDVVDWVKIKKIPKDFKKV